MQAHGSSLASRAFGRHADAGLIVAYQSYQDALQFLSSALDAPNGIALLQGPKGSGKTTVIREQLDWSSRDAAAALVDGTDLRPHELVTDMLSQFGVAAGSGRDEKLLEILNDFATHQARVTRAPVLFFDNADRATESALRLLNWLASLEVRGNYALRVVLTGKAKLSSLLRHGSMRSLARRYPPTYSLNPLTAQEAMAYLRTRLIAAGGVHSEKVFPIEVCERLRELSSGWPGALNDCAREAMDRGAELEAARSLPRVIVTRDGETVSEYELTPGQYVIGRAELADIVIDDSYVSKVHAMLQVYANAIILIDLNSTNGTMVNSMLTPKTVLRDNDVISLGRHRLKIENAPALNAEMDEQVKASDTMTMRSLADLRRSRARRTIVALKHK